MHLTDITRACLPRSDTSARIGAPEMALRPVSKASPLTAYKEAWMKWVAHMEAEAIKDNKRWLARSERQRAAYFLHVASSDQLRWRPSMGFPGWPGPGHPGWLAPGQPSRTPLSKL